MRQKSLYGVKRLLCSLNSKFKSQKSKFLIFDFLFLILVFYEVKYADFPRYYPNIRQVNVQWDSTDMSRFIRYTLLCKAAVFNVPRSDLTV